MIRLRKILNFLEGIIHEEILDVSDLAVGSVDVVSRHGGDAAEMLISAVEIGAVPTARSKVRSEERRDVRRRDRIA